MSEIVITLEDDGSQWLPYQKFDENNVFQGSQRAGSFTISRYCVEDGDPSIFAVMSQVVVTRCEYDWSRAQFMYQALSPHFRPVEIGEIPPEYLIVFHKDENGRVDSFEFKEAAPLYVCPACGKRGGFHENTCSNAEKAMSKE